MHRIVVLGVDGLNPERVRQWFDDLPGLKKMQQEGIWGDMESPIPPAAPQAWVSSQCGQNPGAYGLWDYTYRDDFSYEETELADSKVIDDRVDCLHKILPKMGQKVALINAPVTWPPPEIPGGYCISDFVPRGRETGFVWPRSLEEEVNDLVGGYVFDISDPNPRGGEHTLEEIYRLDTQRITLVRHFVHEKRCDYVFVLFKGPHLIHRLLRDREEGEGCSSHYENTLNDYYKWLDKRIQGISEILDSDTGLLVYSPYSAVKIEGRVNLNEWLIHNGYMTLHEYPEKPTAFKHLTVDWTKTKCWSVGSSGRLYINRKGRERQGIVEYDDYDDLLDELGSKFREIHVEKGPAVQTQVFKREETHSGKYEEYGPDMFIYINNVPWNTNELVGYGLGEVFLSGQQEHSDGEYHGLYGYFCMSGSDVPAIGELKEISVLNIAPTVMEVLRLEPSMNMERPSILSMAKKKEKKSAASKKERVRSRLKALGY